MSISSYLESTKEVFLAIPPREFERRLQQITHAETLENMPGVIIKFDAENYPEKYIGHIAFSEFAIRPVFKEVKNAVLMQIKGNYQAHTQGTSVTYTIQPLRKKLIVWAIFMTMAMVFCTAITLSMPMSNLMRMYLLIIPLLFFAFIASSPFRSHLKVVSEDFEQDLRRFELPQIPNTSIMETTTSPQKSSAWGYIAFMLFGLPFLGSGLSFGYDQYTFFQIASARSEDTVIALKSGTKKGKAAIFSYTTADGNTYKDTSNMYSSPPQYYIGEKITVYYNPTRPQEARTKSFMDTWLFPTVFSIAGFFIELLGIFGFLNRTKD